MGYALGVDLGTTYTAAATWRDGEAEIATLGSRGAPIPSVVLLARRRHVLTGEAADRRALPSPTAWRASSSAGSATRRPSSSAARRTRPRR